MYLVFARGFSDDVPSQLCDTKEEAVKAAKRHKRTVSKRITKMLHAQQIEIGSVHIVTFDDAGKPVKMECIRGFDAE